jgi:hypothetical protein
MSVNEIIDKANWTPNPFKVGDRVILVHGDHTGIDSGSEHTVRYVTKSDINIDACPWNLAHTRFKAVESSPTSDPMSIVKDGAKRLAEAIDNGDITGYYGALGFLMEFVSDLEALTKE